ncbi:MAG: cytochrome c [Mariprofundus sp.]|nr:cytochrome c [Mariprofundus sp.]
MKNNKLKLSVVAMTGFAVLMWAGTSSVAGEKRCTAGGVKVECPTQSDAALKKASDAYEKEANDMAKGKSGSTYGISVFDYLTGVGKRAKKGSATAGESGYGSKHAGDTGGRHTELWDRVKAPKKGEAVYNQWTNNWSPTFKSTLVQGADPNEGKQWYYVYCIACHGWTLQGDGPNAIELDPRPRTLTKGSYMNKKTNLELFTVIKGGGEAVSLSSSMPDWGNVLLDQDIWNVVAFVRAMQDVKPPKDVNDYLAPKSSFKPIAGDVNPLNAPKSADFADAQELLEAGMAGRGGKNLVGGGYVNGGLRKAPKNVAKKVSAGY